MTAAVEARFGILQRIFADIANDMRRDPLEHTLILTYEFDDQQLVNLLSGRNLADNVELQRNQLKFIADMHPVVIYDARKTRDFNQIPHFLDLLPVNPGAYRCHHSKACLFVTRDTVRLVLGSFNLTRTGLFDNREVFHDFLWSDQGRTDLGVLRDFSRLLREGYSQWAQPAVASARVAIADALDARLARWQDTDIPGKQRLLASGYGGSSEQGGLLHLAALWRSISDAPPRKVLVVSPFFDRGEAFLADDLAAAVGAPTELHIVTDEANILRLSRRHYGKGPGAQVRKLSLIPALVSATERDRIARANDSVRLDGLQITRALHAKILVLCSGKHHLVYAGSANFTLKAWNGDNQELGVVALEDGLADALVDQILAAFSADAANAYARLGEAIAPPGAADDEDYVEQPAYPDFIRGIRLEQQVDGEGLVFRFDTAMPARLQDYDISWGRVPLAIEAAASRPIPHQQAYMPLQGGRNLCFVLRADPSRTFLLPFVHHADLARQQDLLIFPTAEDWMRHCLNPTGSAGRPEGEYLPGEEGGPPSSPDAAIDRDTNVVVAMQRYLNLFAAVEAAFNQRAHDLAATAPGDAASRARALDQGFSAPLRLHARLLEQEYRQRPGSAAEEAYLFRLGELVLLCNALAATLPELAVLAHELAARLVATRTDFTLATYLEFVREQLPHA